MAARIYLFVRRDGKVYVDTQNRLMNLGYKFQLTPKGHTEALPPGAPCQCPDCLGTGSRLLTFTGVTIECVSCNGSGFY